MRTAVVAGAALAASVAQAHWCHDLFGTSYNLVVRPASDTITVPAAGSTTLDVWVQNNTSYALKNFAITTAATGYNISVTRQAPKVAGFLMPGESLKHTLTISRSTGGDTLAADSIGFYASMGEGGQSICYGRTACDFSNPPSPATRSAVMRKVGGTQFPTPLPATPMPGGWDQARHLRFTAQVDFGARAQGIDDLMLLYCSGWPSWDQTTSMLTLTACCPNSTTTVCPLVSGTGGCSGSRTWSSPGGTNFNSITDMIHLWAAGELGARKPALSAGQLAALRERLRCSWNDRNLAKRAFPAFVLGYLGEDPASRTLLEGIVSSGTASADDKVVAKAALMLMGNATDKANFRADVTACTTSSNMHLSYICAAALGIADRNDTVVQRVLLPRAGLWVSPGDNDGTYPDFSDGASWYASNLLAIVAWDRRVWAPNGGDTGLASFYGGSGPVDTTPPAKPTATCAPLTNDGTVRVSWPQVTRDENGQPEVVNLYKVYWGNQARPANTKHPGENGFDYSHVDDTTTLFRDYPSLDGTLTYYYAVVAQDAAGNRSEYSDEVNCKPRYAPVARLTCTPTSGTAPLSVGCDGRGSSDGNGTADIVTYSMRLDTEPPQAVSQATFPSLAAGTHQVSLTVTDTTSLSSTATATVTVSSSSGNQPPSAAATATPASGPMPLVVQFSSAGSSDPDAGQTLSFQWDFGDGTTPSSDANPSHTYSAAGTYSVMLTVTDSGSPRLSSYARVTVRVTGNQAPDVSTASATPLTGPVPLSVQFDATGVTDPDGNNVTVSWDFGDQSAASALRSVQHTYAVAGTYTATLRASDDGQPPVAPAQKTFTIVATPPAVQNRPPDCSAATVSPASGPAELTVTLDASPCVDPDGHQMRYLWRVPTSLTTEDRFETAKVEYTFREPGSATVYLLVRDEAASPLEVTREFVVSVGPKAVNEPIRGACGCSTGAAPAGLFALLLVVAGRRRHPRR